MADYNAVTITYYNFKLKLLATAAPSTVTDKSFYLRTVPFPVSCDIPYIFKETAM